MIKTDTILSQRESSLFPDMGEWVLFIFPLATLDRSRRRLIDIGYGGDAV
jgi:hypothetical protein